MRLDGSLVAWGINNNGQASAPPGVFASISAGWAVSCAVRADTSVQCFDSNGSPPSLSVSRCSAGEAHTCCIELVAGAHPLAPCNLTSCPAAPGPVFCFGADYSGQSSPPTVEPILDAIDIAAGWAMTCVLKSDFYIRCWGELASGADQARIYSTRYTQITLVGATLCMLRQDNQQIECSYGADYAPIPTEPDGTPLRWKSVVTLDFHQCGLLLNSSVKCWGNGGWNIQEHTPPLSQTFEQIIGGCLHVCAISTDMQLTCWGDDGHGAVPAPPLPAGYLPVRLQPGYYTGSVLLRFANDTSSSPTLVHFSWGEGTRGTSHPSLQPIPSMRAVRSLSFGDAFGCMVTTANNPLCFGSDHYSQCQPFTMRARVAPRFYFESGTGILPCAPGTYSLGPGATTALCSGPCAAGRYGAPGQQQSDAQCSAPCPAGTSCMAGSTLPQVCDPYTYSSSPGASVCEVCSGGLWVFSNRTRCGMPDCSAGSEPADNQCVACSIGTFSPGGGKPCQVCAQGFSAPYDSMDHCLDCSGGASEGLSCSNTGLTILPGFFLLASPTADTLFSMRCPPQFCEGDASNSVSAMPCSANRNTSGSNLFCASCIDGYDEWNGRCVVCPSSPRWGLLFLLVCVSFAVVLVFHLLSQSSAETATISSFSYFIQVISQQGGAQQLSFGGALAFMSSLNFLHTSGGLCLAKLSPYDYALVRMMSAPIAFAELGIIAVVHWMLWTMGHCRARSSSEASGRLEHENAEDAVADPVPASGAAVVNRPAPSVTFPLHRYLRSACCLLLFLYQDLSFTSLSLLTCVGVGDSSLVYYSPGLDCADSRYTGSVRVLAVLLVLVGVVGIPVLVVTVLIGNWIKRRKQQQMKLAREHSAGGKELEATAAAASANQQALLAESLLSGPSPPRARVRSRSPFAPFDESFHSGAYCWQIVLLLRRLLLISLELALLQQAAGLRYMCFAYFHLASLLLHARFRPFLRSLDNDLESFALVMLTALSGSLMLVNQQESDAVLTLHTIMILAPVAVFVVIIAGHKVPAVAARIRRSGIAAGCCFRGARGRDSNRDRAVEDSSTDRSLEDWSTFPSGVRPHTLSQARV